jgi:hypothetical protein
MVGGKKEEQDGGDRDDAQGGDVYMREIVYDALL